MTILGTSNGREGGDAVAADGLGNVYVSGYTSGSLGGPNAGGQYGGDPFLAKYNDLIIPEPASCLLSLIATAAVMFIRKWRD